MSEGRVIQFRKRRRMPSKEDVARVADSASKAFLAIARAAEIVATVTYVLAKELGIADREKK